MVILTTMTVDLSKKMLACMSTAYARAALIMVRLATVGTMDTKMTMKIMATTVTVRRTMSTAGMMLVVMAMSMITAMIMIATAKAMDITDSTARG